MKENINANMYRIKNDNTDNTDTHTQIQLNLIYIAPKQYYCFKALYRAQCLDPLRGSTMATSHITHTNLYHTHKKKTQTGIHRGKHTDPHRYTNTDHTRTHTPPTMQSLTY